MCELVRSMFWEIVKTALLSLLVIYLTHNIYLSFFKKSRAIPISISNDVVANENNSHVTVKSSESNMVSEPVINEKEEGQENDMKSELMDFLNSGENESNLNNTSLGVTSLSELPDDKIMD